MSNPINYADPSGHTAWPSENIAALQALKDTILQSAKWHNRATESNLSDEAFAALMAAHLNRESRFGAPTKRLLWDKAGDIAGGLFNADTSTGIANIRPSVAIQILTGRIPGVDGEYLPICGDYEIHGTQFQEWYQSVAKALATPGRAQAGAVNYLKSKVFAELQDQAMSVEYLAANIERGVDRAIYYGINPSVFNLGNWLWTGVQDPLILKDEQSRGNDLYRHGAALVMDMPMAFSVLGLITTDYNAYNADEAEFIEP